MTTECSLLVELSLQLHNAKRGMCDIARLQYVCHIYRC